MPAKLDQLQLLHSGRPKAPRASLQLGAVLDPVKAQQAITSYEAFLERLCKSLNEDPSSRSRRLAEVGLSSDSDPVLICTESARYLRPLASGALLKADADEVLLEVPSGRSGAAGERTLALLRRTPSGYELLQHLLTGGRFEPRIRLEVPDRRNVLVLCEESGRQGLYFGKCGFFGWGSFTAEGPPNATENELELVRALACGSGAAVTLGDIALRGERVLATLVVEHYVRLPNEPDDTGGSLCPRKSNAVEERFVLEYVVDDTVGLRRLTGIPEPAMEVLRRY